MGFLANRVRSSAASGALLAALLGATACEPPGAYGDANALIVATTPEIWESVGDTLAAALQPTILTVTREQAFRVTYQDPEAAYWDQLKHFRHVLLIGHRDHPWMAEVLAEANEADVPEPPGIFHVTDVWASRNQLVTAILLPRDAEPEAVIPLLDELRDRVDGGYREYARSRMFLTGRDSALLDTLRREAGFSLLLPQVYRTRRLADSIRVFRNDNPDPSELIRQVTVAWRSPMPDTVTEQEVLEWRRALSERYAEADDDAFAQLNNLRAKATERVEEAGTPPYLQVQAAWNNPPEADWPAGGPFISRAYLCREQDRLYLVDAWLYAPGRDKYEYMIQLETILDSFRCGGS